jgi:hypothetical protein
MTPPVSDDAFAGPVPAAPPSTQVAVLNVPSDEALAEPAYAEQAEGQLTEEEVKLKAFYDAETAWKTRFDEDWEHERFEYKGDYLAVRKPQMQALAAFQLSSSRFIDDERRNDVVGLFIDQHIGRESYDHMTWRLMNPDDPDYTTSSISDVIGGLVEMAVADIKEQAKIEAEKLKGQKGLRAVR